MFRITKKISSNSENPKTVIETIEIFKDLYAYILPNGMGKNRVELFRNSLVKYGACLIDENKELELKLPCSNIESKDDFDKFIKYLIVVDENTFKTWANIEKALNKKSFLSLLKKTFKIILFVLLLAFG